MQETFKGKKTFYAKTRKDWRKWLEKNSETEKIRLAYFLQ